MSARAAQIAVVGGGTATDAECAMAARVGGLLAQAGATVVCGGRGGVMAAVARGARDAGGEVIGILPGTEPGDAGPDVTHVVATGVGEARNLAVVASAAAVIAIGGEWGTLAEIAFARRLGRPVVVLAGWAVDGPGAMAGGPGIARARDPGEAVRIALDALPM